MPTAAATCAQTLNTEKAACNVQQPTRGMRRATPPMQRRTHEERSGCRLTCPTVARRNPAPLSVKRQCATVKSRAAHAVSAIRVCASTSRTRRRYAPAGSITLYAAVSVSVAGIVPSDLVEVRRSTHGQARDQSHKHARTHARAHMHACRCTHMQCATINCAPACNVRCATP
jgi:hypothetical protein